MRSDFIPSDVQDASERRRQPVAAFNAAPTNPSESFASILLEPRDLAHQKTQLTAQASVAPPGPPASPFRGISAFAGAPAVIPSAVVPPVEALTTASDLAAPTADASAPPAFGAAEPTSAEAASPTVTASPAAPATPPSAPALETLSGRREPIPAFAAAKPEASATLTAAAPVERVQGNAAYGASPLSADEALALANGDASSVPKAPSLFGDEGMTTADFFSIINPLQHLPLIGALYRDLTGDTIKPGARVLGGMLFGGPVGLVGGAFNAAVEHDIGTDAGGALLALVRGTPLSGTATPSATLAAAPDAATSDKTPPAQATATAAPAPAPVGAGAAVAQAQTGAPTPAPLPVSAPRVMAPPRPIAPAAPAEARILPSTPSATPAVAAEATAEPSKPALPVSFAPAAAAPSAAPAADAKPSGFALSPGGREFPVPARTNNIQPRQPIPTARADLTRSRELAPMAPLTVRSEAPRPDRSVSPAQLLTPGLNQTDMTPGMPMSGASNTRMPPVSSAPLGVPGLPPSALPDAMTKALDKYDALLKSRKGGVLNQQS